MNKQRQEALVILQEECAEVIQAVSKCIRFGLDDSYSGVPNRKRLENEIGDLLALVDVLHSLEVISYNNIDQQIVVKKQKLKQWSSLGDL